MYTTKGRTTLEQLDVKAEHVRHIMTEASQEQITDLWHQLDLSTIYHDWALDGQVVNAEELEGNFRVDPVMLEENLMFGTPETVIEKLKLYEALGVDAFIYYASMGMDMDQQKESLKLFIDKVMPAYA